MNYDNDWLKWWETATPEEKHLAEKVLELDGLFGDMLFLEDTCTAPLLNVQVKVEGQWVDDRMPLPDSLAYFDPTWFRFKVFHHGDRGDGTAGYFNPQKQELAILEDKLDSDAVILHELIHLHEFVLREVPNYFRDMIFWALERQVRERIPRLDDLIAGHAHSLNQEIIYTAGGAHGVLFLLKSLELDMRMEYPLGTVFGYGRTDVFKGYEVLAQRKEPDSLRRVLGALGAMNAKNWKQVRDEAVAMLKNELGDKTEGATR